MRGEQRHRLGEIDRRAAAERDQPFALFFAVDLERCEGRLLGRVRRHVVEDEAAVVAASTSKSRSTSPAATMPLSVTISGRLISSARRSSGQFLQDAEAEAGRGEIGD
jgi:hypothetical protein